LLGLSGAVASAQEIDRIRCLSTVFEPYVIEEQDGRVVGVDADVVREIGRRLNIDIEIELKPWVRLEKDIERGAEDCAFAYFRTAQREAYMDFTQVPLHITNYVLFTRTDQTLDYRGLSDIEGFRVGVNLGFKTPPEFEDAVERKSIFEIRVEEDAQSFQMLNAERIDAVLTNSFVGAYQVKNLGYEDITPLFPPLSSTPAFLAFSKKSNLSSLVQKFDAALYEILIDGTYQKIFDRYMKLPSDTTAD
jgi:polar amino acid transport system substrate-binding protein